MFPKILIHKDLPHLIWICTYNDNEELESALINQYTKEVEKKIIKEDDVEELIKDFSSKGWVKGFIPDINIINDGEITQTLKISDE
jgi:hypothetical protein